MTAPSERMLQAKATLDAHIASMREQSPDDLPAMASLVVLQGLANELFSATNVMDAIIIKAQIDNELAKLREHAEAEP